LEDILTIALCGVICGADNWVAIETFGQAREAWFRTFLSLENGIPTHDTFSRVFGALDPKAFQKCFIDWMSGIAEVTAGEVVAIDGKTLRRSFDRGAEKAAIHMVSAWATENGVVLGQEKTAEKSNEITAIPKLLALLDVKGAIVTIDAMGCQRTIAQAVVDRGADYVFGLKGNQGTLHTEVKTFFDDAAKTTFKEIVHDQAETVDGDHGRIEIRRTVCTSEINWFEDKPDWAGLRSFAMVESERTVGDKTSVERRYFISSLPGNNATQMAHAIRRHWCVENQLHWTLDVAFREDECRSRKDHRPENFAVLRHMALNLLKKERSIKLGVPNKRLKAGWEHPYLLKVLGF
jgi:predicted transposase YbfD/YdcC